jgi:hypothetical protein
MADSNKDLSTLIINRVIFHDVPNNSKVGSASPTLAEDETTIDANHRSHLKTKLTRVLGSKSAYPVDFDERIGSPVPGYVRGFTEGGSKAPNFIEMTQKLAEHLFAQQHGGISPGLLCAIDVTASSSRGLVLMKLEREEGAQLELTSHKGKKAFDMSVLDNLVLTDGTRLFKSAFFLRVGKGDDDFRSVVCDSQLHVTASSEMARFWLRFLGCQFQVAPRVATQRFYDSALQFINTAVPDPVTKNDLYEHLQSQMKSPTRTFAPLKFIQDYVPEDYQQPFKIHLQEHKIPTSQFQKDVEDIHGRLRQQSFTTTRGVRVTVPAENSQIVEIKPEQIIVNDELLKVDRR